MYEVNDDRQKKKLEFRKFGSIYEFYKKETVLFKFCNIAVVREYS